MIDLYALLLILYPSLPVPSDPPPGAFAALQRQAMALDLVGTSETWGEWTFEVDWCRRTYEHVRDCPPSHDAQRFTHLDATGWLSWLHAAREHASHAELWRTWERDYWHERRVTIDRHIEAWYAVKDCRSYPVSCRRQALGRLRDLIGPDAYYAGRMPDL